MISKEIIQEVAQRSYDRGDVRYGLKLLAKIGEKAETSGSGKILKEHLILKKKLESLLFI